MFFVKGGPYKYVEDLDNNKAGMCHQLEFTLLATVMYEKLNSKLQELLRHRGTVTKFKYPLEDAELDMLIQGNGITQTDSFRGNEHYSSEKVPVNLVKR